MRNLFIILFASALMFSCSEEAEDMMEKSADVVEDTMDAAEEMVEDTAEAVTEMADDGVKGPELEPLPDWDSLPPIEAEMAAEEGSTMMENAEEMVDMAKDKAEEMKKKE